MKLDPVFVLAPKPATPPNPTRRAFVLVGTGFALGATLGGACGYAAGAAAAKPAAAEEELKPSGDADLDELRRLAVKAPIDELVASSGYFVEMTRRTYRTDPILWRGMERLAQAVIADTTIPNRRVFSKVIAQVIEQADPALTKGLQPLAAELRKVK